MMTFLCPINPSVVFEKLASLKCGKALGPNGWPVEVFKKCACTPLCIRFINILPQDWKTGHIIAIYKKGNKTKVNKSSVFIYLMEEKTKMTT